MRLLARQVDVGRGKVWLEPDTGDVVDPRPAQPPLEERLLEVAAKLRATVVALDRTDAVVELARAFISE